MPSSPIPVWYFQAALAAILLVIAGWFSIRLLRWRRRVRRERQQQAQLTIRLADFEHCGASGRETLLLKHIPARIVLLVVAPLGRGGRVPATDALFSVLDRTIPGIAGPLSMDKPTVRSWPEQLSVSGFCEFFHGAIRLPDKGKGTPYSAIAGKIDSMNGHRFVIGMLLRSKEPNNLGTFSLADETEWANLLSRKDT